MKNYLITLLILSSNTCLSMHNKKDKKSMIIQHDACVHKTLVHSNVIFFHLKKNNKNTVAIYDLTKHEIIKKFEDGGESIFQLQDTLFFMPSKKNKFCYYTYITLSNYSEQSFNFNDEIENYLKSFNDDYLLFSLKNNGYHLHDIERDTTEKIASKKIEYIKFNPDSTHLAFFKSDSKKIVVYTLNPSELFKEFTCEKTIVDLFFPQNDRIIFSYDKQNYVLLKIDTEEINSIKLDDKHYEYDGVSDQISRYFHFQLPFKHQCTVYDLEKNVLYNLRQKAPGTSLICNADGKYALYATTNSCAILYETASWEPKKIICFENGHLNPIIAFSPCGKFALAVARNKNWNSGELKIYDINNDILLKVGSCLLGCSSDPFQFYENKTIIYVSSEKTITIYDYTANKKQEIKTEISLSHFQAHEGILAISSKTKTEVIELKNIEFELCEILKETNYKEPMEEISSNNNIPDCFNFYDEKGNCIEIKKESEGYCTIA